MVRPRLHLGHGRFDASAGGHDAPPAERDQRRGALDLLSEPVDVDGVALQLGQDGFELGQGFGVPELADVGHAVRVGRVALPARSVGLAASSVTVHALDPAARRAVGQRGDQLVAWPQAGDRAHDRAIGSAGDAPPARQGSGRVERSHPSLNASDGAIGLGHAPAAGDLHTAAVAVEPGRRRGQRHVGLPGQANGMVVEPNAGEPHGGRRALRDPAGRRGHLAIGAGDEPASTGRDGGPGLLDVVAVGEHAFNESVAQAVGVFSAVWATSSATLRSISWPRPVSTGTGERGDGTSDNLGVEGGEVGAGAPTADDDDHVQRWQVLERRAEPGDGVRDADARPRRPAPVRRPRGA